MTILNSLSVHYGSKSNKVQVPTTVTIITEIHFIQNTQNSYPSIILLTGEQINMVIANQHI